MRDSMINQDIKKDIDTVPKIKTTSPDPSPQRIDKSTKRKLTKNEIESLVENKRSEMDINIYDMVTKNQIEEQKLQELLDIEENAEEKEKLLLQMRDLIQKNENTLNHIRE